MEIARENIRQAGLENQITTAAGDVHGMPFEKIDPILGLLPQKENQ